MPLGASPVGAALFIPPDHLFRPPKQRTARRHVHVDLRKMEAVRPGSKDGKHSSHAARAHARRNSGLQPRNRRLGKSDHVRQSTLGNSSRAPEVRERLPKQKKAGAGFGVEVFDLPGHRSISALRPCAALLPALRGASLRIAAGMPVD